MTKKENNTFKMNRKNLLYLIVSIQLFTTCYSQNKKLRLIGQDSLSKDFLNKTKYKQELLSVKELENEHQRIIKKAQQNGYFFAEIIENEEKKDTLSKKIFVLNKKYKTITINYNEKDITKRELESLLPKNTNIKNRYFILETSNIKQSLNKILEHISSKGKTFSNIQLKNIHIERKKVITDLKIKVSKTRNITDIKIKGYEKFPEKFIKHYLKIKQNQKINLISLDEKNKGLQSLKFAKAKNKPEILFSKDSTIVYLTIEKIKSNTFEGFLGFSSNEESGKVELNGNIDLKLLNNLNKGEEINIKYSSTENEQKQTNVQIKIPYIINSPISITGELNIFKKDSSFTNNTQSLITSYTLNKNTELGVGIKKKSSNTLNSTTNTEDYETNTYSLNFRHEVPHKNSLFEHKTKTSITTSTGKRKTDSGSNKQQEIKLSTEYIFEINNKNSIFLKNDNYYLFNSNTLENELLYIGGINSIRGIKENSIPSTQYSIINSEYRITLNQKLFTHTVFDYAITKSNDTNRFDKIIGFGIGFGINTNNNMLRFVFANSKINNQQIKMSESKIHLSLSTRF